MGIVSFYKEKIDSVMFFNGFSGSFNILFFLKNIQMNEHVEFGYATIGIIMVSIGVGIIAASLNRGLE